MAGEKKKQQPFWLGYGCTQKYQVTMISAEIVAVEPLLPWQQHAVSRIRIAKRDCILTYVAAHPLDQTK